SRCTVQAPQRATPQPNLVPFMPRRSRKTHSNGMSGDASPVGESTLIFNGTMIDLHSWMTSMSTRPISDKVYHRAALRGRANSCVNDSYGSKADVPRHLGYVRLIPESGHRATRRAMSALCQSRPSALRRTAYSITSSATLV